MTDPTVQRVEPIPPVLSIEEARKLLGVSRQTLYDEINAGRLRSAKIGPKRRVVRGTEIIRYLDTSERRERR